MTTNPDLIASLVQREFQRLPSKRKPVVRDNGLREWVPLSGIVAEGADGRLTCLSLATGMKCLPSSKLSRAQGNVLHDWHAEILAIRAFNCFVLDECQALANGSKSASEFIRRRSGSEMSATPDSAVDRDDCADWHGQPFAWRDDVLLHMYCSEAPCGDASMELTMASQADATPWAVVTTPQKGPSSPAPVPIAIPLEPATPLLGRGYFSQLGVVRRKPSRGDAPPTLSKSCSDKLSLRQCVSLLSSLTSLIVRPDHAYIATLVLPKSQYSASGCRRAFSDGQGQEYDDDDDDDIEAGSQQARMAPLALPDSGAGWGGGYKFQPFSVKTTDLEFAFSRRSTTTSPSPPPVPSGSFSPSPLPNSSPDPTTPTPPTTDRSSVSERGNKITPSNLSTALTASGREETTLNGVLQGRKAADADIRGASFASRRRMWSLAVEVANSLGGGLREASQAQDIQEVYGAVVPASPSNLLPTGTSTEPGPASETKTRAEIETQGRKTYAAVKGAPLLRSRQRAKEAARRLALRGWVRNTGDEGFAL
ncbi:adenosine deaminase/editase [Nemania sp. NC0429]|nr:adenosine deaminase/editase [Nemania sp. NC0429]